MLTKTLRRLFQFILFCAIGYIVGFYNPSSTIYAQQCLTIGGATECRIETDVNEPCLVDEYTAGMWVGSCHDCRGSDFQKRCCKFFGI